MLGTSLLNSVRGTGCVGRVRSLWIPLPRIVLLLLMGF
jgi:hypothetical protein